MPKIADHIAQLEPYQAGKAIEELKRELGLERVIKLASNENPYGPSPRVKEALASALNDPSLHRYPDAKLHALRERLARHHQLDPNQVCFGNGSNELIDLLCRVFVTPEDHIVYGTPSFACYRIAALAMNAAFTEVPLRDLIHWDADALIGAIKPNTKLLFLANPNNPTGAHLSRDQLLGILEALPHDALAVIDEAYIEYVDAKDYSSALELRDSHPNLVILRTFSKAFALASLRVGYAIATEEIIGDLERLRAPFNINGLARIAVQAALDDLDHVAHCAQKNQTERSRLKQELETRSIEVAPSQANFLLLKTALPGRELYERLLTRGVIIRALGQPLEAWARVSLGTPEENDLFLKALDEVLAG